MNQEIRAKNAIELGKFMLAVAKDDMFNSTEATYHTFMELISTPLEMRAFLLSVMIQGATLYREKLVEHGLDVEKAEIEIPETYKNGTF